ncbi:hypothetical protein KIH31_17835 [Paenarthrobacter sp. DKR-5]|uniref:hypothetical protein n=1 Tax=Paenarthrobacter sp. DKR-5 TaxID=2835535 RepID=UPI001BDBCCAA|nr:hypothetical protein [Paenarthrobacter sp. DKR-5]MBT1004450.1 hypothetical protein [Paenarthrobacter sp. DKR-5]
MTENGRIFGWAFGDGSRSGDEAYVDQLKAEALENARQAAAGKDLGIRPGTAVYTVITEGETLVELSGTAENQFVVRCTVELEGPGASKVRAEGPMNG